MGDVLPELVVRKLRRHADGEEIVQLCDSHETLRAQLQKAYEENTTLRAANADAIAAGREATHALRRSDHRYTMVAQFVDGKLDDAEAKQLDT